MKLHNLNSRNLAANRQTQKTTKVPGISGLYLYNGVRKQTYKIKVNHQGKLYTKTLGDARYMSLDEAKTQAHQYLSDLYAGRIDNGKSLTVNEFIRSILIPRAEFEGIDVSYLKRRLRPFSLYLGTVRITDITRIQLERYLLAFHSKGLKPATINRYRDAVSKVLSYAVELGMIDRNPIKSIKKLPENNQCDRVLRNDELKTLIEFAWAEGSCGSLALLVSLFTGLRIGNVVTLKWDHIDLNVGTLFIPKTKNGKAYKISLNKPAIQILQHCHGFAGQEWVFPNAAGSGPIGAPRAAIDRANKAVEALIGPRPRFKIHDLRRTFASRMLAATNGDLRAVQNALMHSNVTTTERYAHYQDHRLLSASEATGDKILIDSGCSFIAEGTLDSSKKDGGRS